MFKPVVSSLCPHRLQQIMANGVNNLWAHIPTPCVLYPPDPSHSSRRETPFESSLFNHCWPSLSRTIENIWPKQDISGITGKRIAKIQKVQITHVLGVSSMQMGLPVGVYSASGCSRWLSVRWQRVQCPSRRSPFARCTANRVHTRTVSNSSLTARWTLIKPF